MPVSRRILRRENEGGAKARAEAHLPLWEIGTVAVGVDSLPGDSGGRSCSGVARFRLFFLVVFKLQLLGAGGGTPLG